MKRKILLFIAALTMVAGAVATQPTTSQASIPPSGYKDNTIVFNVEADDGYVGRVDCLTTAFSSAYGYYSYCTQQHGTYGTRRYGIYNLNADSFGELSDWGLPWGTDASYTCDSSQESHDPGYVVYNKGFQPVSTVWAVGYVYHYSGAQQARPILVDTQGGSGGENPCKPKEAWRQAYRWQDIGF